MRRMGELLAVAATAGVLLPTPHLSIGSAGDLAPAPHISWGSIDHLLPTPHISVGRIGHHVDGYQDQARV